MYEGELLEAILKAKTIIVVCGAGRSVSAVFPSFVDPKTGRYLPGKK
jgi:NAD-dependent SIR2 family protein deacetylase